MAQCYRRLTMKIPGLVERLKMEIEALESQVEHEVNLKAQAQEEAQEQTVRAQVAESRVRELATERAQLALLVVKLLPSG